MALPTLRQLQYLAALADKQHFGRAAETCNVTQSTLSAGIKDLEMLLDAHLVDRTKRSVVFTPLGEEVVRRGRRLLADADELARLAERSSDPLAGTVRLGVIPTVAPFLLPRVLPHLRERFPQLKLLLVEDLTHRLTEDLLAGRVDLLLIALPCDTRGVECRPLFDDPFHLACRPDHPLAERGEVRVDDLSREPLLLLRDGHCLREHALAACQLADQTETMPFDATSLHTLVQMVDNGLGVTLLPELALEGGILAGTSLTTRPLGDNHPARSIGLAWRRGTGRRAEFEMLGREIAAQVKRTESQRLPKPATI